MKSNLLKNVLITVALFSFITILYYLFIVRPKINDIRDLDLRENALQARKSDLVEIRLSLIRLAKSSVQDRGFFDNFLSDTQSIEEGMQTSQRFINSKNINHLEKELTDRDLHVQESMEIVLNEVQKRADDYGRILEYDMAVDLAVPLGDDNFDALLGRMLATREGLKQYENDPFLGEVARESVDELNKTIDLLDDPNEVDLISEVETAVLKYNILRIKALDRVKEPLIANRGVEMLTDLTNLIVSYDGSLKQVSHDKEEISASILAGRGLFSFFKFK